MAAQCIVHEQADTVAVVVVEDLQPGTEIAGWIVETDEAIALQALDAVPLGHKIALRDITAGETIMKDGHAVGLAIVDISRGRHVHTHNVKSSGRELK